MDPSGLDPGFPWVYGFCEARLFCVERPAHTGDHTMTKIAVHPEFLAIHTGEGEITPSTITIVPVSVVRNLVHDDVFRLYEHPETHRCWYQIEGAYPECGESLKEIAGYVYDGETITIRVGGEIDPRRYTVEN